MSTPVKAIDIDKLLTEALKTMQDNRIRRLAITKKGNPVGILTERIILDKLNALSKLWLTS